MSTQQTPYDEPTFLLEDEPTPMQEKQPSNQPWYKSLPQANMQLGGKLAARSVLGAAQLHPAALALDLGGLAVDQILASHKRITGKDTLEKAREYIPSSQTVIKPAEHLLGLEENPTGVERVFKNVGEYIQLAKGGGLRKQAAKALALTAGEEIAGNVAGEEGRAAFKTVAPLGAKATDPLVTGRQATGVSTLATAVENNPELNQLYQYGRRIGLTDAQLTPILQPDWKTRLLGRFSKKTPSMLDQINDTREQIRQNYRNLKATGRQTGVLNPQQQTALHNDLATMHADISRTNVIGPDNQAILNTLEEAMNGLTTQPQTIETLMNTYQNINQIPNWTAANDGRRRLAQVNTFFQRAISDRNPRIGNEFRHTNRMYQRQAQFRDQVGLGRTAENILSVAETAGLLSGLAYGVTTGDYKNAGNIIGLSLARRLSTQLLTNPRLQGMHRNMMRALTTGDQTALAKIMKDEVGPWLKKEAPVEWEAANLPTFQLEE